MYRVRSLINDTQGNGYIYPYNGRTGLSKVSLEPHGSKEDFDISRAMIGHSKLSQEQHDRRGANSICA